MTAVYRNSWYRPSGNSGPEFYETDAKPVEHFGCLIYERIRGTVWDTVKNDVCIGRSAGLGAAKKVAELLAMAGKEKRK